MNIGLFGKSLDKQCVPYIQKLVETIEHHFSTVSIYESYYELVKDVVHFSKKVNTFYKIPQESALNIDYLLSIGGDGTLLDAIPIIQDSGIPILGINTGRMGFLASVSKNDIELALKNLYNKEFSVEKRTLLNVKPKNLCNKINFALNEVTVMKKDSSSMINIIAEVNNCYLNTYWADGLIIATPTGSTGYSLSCGGPILSPDSENFIITPIASHNLTVRPIVIPDNVTIKLYIKSRSDSCLLGLDSRSYGISNTNEIVISKEKFKINLIKLNQQNFYATIRDKLLWGNDIRN